MKNTPLLVIFLVSLVLCMGCYAYAVLYIPEEWTVIMLTILLNVIIFSGAFLLITNGTIQQTVYWKWILFMIIPLAVGSIVRTQSWDIGSLIMATGLIACPILYLVRFSKKEEKLTLDWLKMIWVSIHFTIRILIETQIINNDFILFSIILLAIVVFVFWSNVKKMKEEEIEFDFMKIENLPE